MALFGTQGSDVSALERDGVTFNVTEASADLQAVIDEAVQIFGGQGVVSGAPMEKLYREIRALRIYEGASEVQKVVIAKAALAARDA